jgi:hypothetical protein
VWIFLIFLDHRFFQGTSGVDFSNFFGSSVFPRHPREAIVLLGVHTRGENVLSIWLFWKFQKVTRHLWWGQKKVDPAVLKISKSCQVIRYWVFRKNNT